MDHEPKANCHFAAAVFRFPYIFKMVAIEKGAIMHEMVKRADNWPAHNAGVMVVFCIVFVGT